MFRRMYHLYAIGMGPYEIVPSGWSFLAALLGPFWALAYGMFLRYAVLTFVPAIPLLALSAIHQAFGVLAITYLLAVSCVYFPLKAFSWREGVLRSKGYELRCSLVANSSKDMLKKYAEQSGELDNVSTA